MKICLCVVAFMLAGCSTYTRVERHHYFDAPSQTTPPPPPHAVLLEPQPARMTTIIEYRR